MNWRGTAYALLTASMAAIPLVSPAQTTARIPRTAELEKIAKAIVLIKQEFVDLVGDDKLAAGCRAGMLRDLRANVESSASKPALDAIGEMFDSVKERTADVADARKLVDACLRGMLEFDPKSSYLD